MSPFSLAPQAPLSVRAAVYAFRRVSILRPARFFDAAVLLLALANGPVAAQTTLEPVVVIGSRAPLPRDRIAADVVVIDAERLRASSADSLEDLLQREAGVRLSRSGGAGQNAGVFIRGSASVNTVVLVDGVRVGSATAGLASIEGISLAQIERIEVLRGPASSLYGADAVGGVVQIFTRSGLDGPQLSARIAAGGYASSEGSLSLSRAFGAFDVAASVSREQSHGVSALRPNDAYGQYNPDADGYARSSGTLRLGFTPAPGHRLGLKLSAARLQAAYDSAVYSPSFVPDPSPDFRNLLRTRAQSLDYNGRLNDRWSTTVLLAHAEDDLRSGAAGFAASASNYLTRRDQASWQNVLALTPQQQLLVALDRLTERAQSSAYAADVRRTNNALVLGYTGNFGAHALQADVRHDDNSVYGGVDTGRLGWSLQLAPQWRLRALAGTSFRAPSFNDLVYPNYGVITVRPEHGRSGELGLNWQQGDGRLAATVYRNQVRNLIGYEANPAQCPAGYTFGCARNINRARLQGVTLDGSQRWGALQIGGTLDWLAATDEATGQRLPRRAARQASVNASYTQGAWTLGSELFAVSRRPDLSAALGGYATVDLTARWRAAPGWQVEAQLRNVANRDVEPVQGYQGLGRQAWLGLRYEGKGL